MKRNHCKRILFVAVSLLLALLMTACDGGAGAFTTLSTTGTTSARPTTTTARPSTSTAASTSGSTATTEATTDDGELPELILNTTNRRSYSTSATGVVIREINIKTNIGGDPVVISQLTDVHINYCTANDLLDPVLKSTYENRTWLKDGASLMNLKMTLKEVEDTDMIVLTGDIYDYYSEGTAKKADEYIFSKYDNILACIGNHEPYRQMQGTVKDPLTYDERRDLVADSWCNDISYESTVVKNKVLLIAIDNSEGFRDEQIPRLTADLEMARENGYAVLLFYHVPICTGRTEDNNIDPEWGPHEKWSFGTTQAYVGMHSKGVDAKIYSLIRKNGDIIRGAFCGHVHGDFYTELPARTFEGEETIIPQYIMTPVANNNGHCLKITID